LLTINDEFPKAQASQLTLNSLADLRRLLQGGPTLRPIPWLHLQL
jgi:hypothetical protein